MKEKANVSRKEILIRNIAIAILVILAFFTIAGSLYWFAYRPGAVRKYCFDLSSARSGINDDNWYRSNTQRSHTFMYEACMESKGLKP